MGTEDEKSRESLVPLISASGGLDSTPRAGKSLESHKADLNFWPLKGVCCVEGGGLFLPQWK